MDADLRKVKKLTAFMRSHGLLKLKTAEIELELHPTSLQHPSGLPETKEDPKPEHSEEDVLFWSAPGHIPEEAKQ